MLTRNFSIALDTLITPPHQPPQKAAQHHAAQFSQMYGSRRIPETPRLSDADPMLPPQKTPLWVPDTGTGEQNHRILSVEKSPPGSASPTGITGGKAPLRIPRVEQRGLCFLGRMGSGKGGRGERQHLPRGRRCRGCWRLSSSHRTTSQPRRKLFPAPGRHRRPPALRPSIPREPQRSRGGEGKSEAREGGRSGLSDPPQGSFPAARSRSTPRARSVLGTPGGGTRCPGRRARERGWREGGKGGCRPYLSALVNLRKAWRRSWKER